MTTTVEQIVYNYTGDGSTTQFAYPAKFLDSDSIEVRVDGVLQSSGYTVSGAGNQSGGTVTFDAAPASAAEISLVNNPALTQTANLTYDGNFPSTTVENMLDKLMMAIRVLSQRVDKCWRNPIWGDDTNEGGLVTFTDADTTPSIAQGHLFTTANTGATSITQFDGGVAGQEFMVYFSDADTTLVNGAKIILSGATNVNPAAGSIISFVMGTSAIALEVSRNF